MPLNDPPCSILSWARANSEALNPCIGSKPPSLNSRTTKPTGSPNSFLAEKLLILYFLLPLQYVLNRWDTQEKQTEDLRFQRKNICLVTVATVVIALDTV